MTKPTEEQIKALKPGDRVLVEAEVVEVAGEIRLFVVVRGQGDGRKWPCWVTHDQIHSILPREIKVGDKVRHLGWDDAPWEVLAGPRPCESREKEYAIWRERDGFTLASAGSLRVIS